ncbi:bifunctional RNase H/acid phosphatase [Ornithinimicrobium sp. F0845]|uniref:bifunctional RNase H/acid phosphatase n=1 Tax=Ornithinimicrobium sp. F0845 TaxID=2926412 RepID=UPI001FF1EADA|nr:bifunctional RNase H/acid phosphatase [Ornithinimicrobium sp. F0845]MCK0114108.1 bifunctional RNase H/acid phosphatase [Ornithinimicrobium sp. F0845]
MPSGRGRRLVVEADGGSRGNPGVAGYGALVRDADGTLLAERAAPLGTASNNVAEYTGLIEGLRAVLDLGLADGATVEVRMDSKLVVEQMSGRWKIKHEDMRRLALQARDLARQIQAAGGRVTYAWIPRAENSAADALSNDGMDGETVRRDHVESVVRPGAREAEPAPSLFDLDDPAPPVKAEPTFGEVKAPVGEEVFSTETDPTLEGSCRLILVRHGVTDFTRAHKLDGRGGANPPLNEEGLAQAAAAAGAVRRLIDRSGPAPIQVLTSSLTRAMQTGGAIAEALGVTPEVDRDWDEQAFGDWDGATMADLVTRSGQELLALRQDPAYSRPGGESRTQLTGRVVSALGRAIARGGTVVVATHRLPLMVVLSQVLGIDSNRAWSIATAPASLTAFEFWPDGGAQVAFVNDTHHLHDL